MLAVISETELVGVLCKGKGTKNQELVVAYNQ